MQKVFQEIFQKTFRKTFRKILFVVSFLFFINLCWVLVRSGFGNTFLLSLGFFVAASGYAVFYEYLREQKWILRVVFVGVVLYSGIGVFAFTFGRNDTATFDEDVVIVLGAGVRGEEISRMLQNRLDAAIEYHARNPNAMIIVSGGLGNRAVISEAEAMARYLEANGVSRDIILLEDGSHSTYQNMRLSLEILDRYFSDGENGVRVVVITNDFHIYRAVMFTRIVGIGGVVGVDGVDGATSFHGSTPLVSLPGALVREVAAIVKMWVVGT